MEAHLKLDLENAGDIMRSVSPDLQDSDRLKFNISVKKELEVDIKAKSLGVLRGGLNTAMKLVKLSKKLVR